MTVRCPACGTRYRLPPRSRLGARPTFRCTRCEHVFDPEAGADGPAVDDEVEAPAATVDLRTDDEPDDTPGPAAEAFGLDDVDADDRDEAATPPLRQRRRGGARGAPAWNAAAAEPAGAGTARFALHTMLAVTLVYAVASIWVYTHPQRLAALLARVPFVGAPETRISPANIQLGDVRGEYHRLQGETLVFAITGTALNNAPVPVSGVQVQGSIKGDVEQHLTVFAGAVPRDVQELSLREVDLLQTLVPPNDWSLAPGAQASFLVVFKEPAVPLEEFGAEVVAVRRSDRRPAPHPATR